MSNQLIGNYHGNAVRTQYLDNPEYDKNWDRIFGKKKKKKKPIKKQKLTNQ